MDPDDWDELMAADEAAGRAVPEVVRRHRCAGVLTWALLHQIEGEVLAELETGGEHSASMLNMTRSAPVLGYPNDDRPVSLSSASPALHSELALDECSDLAVVAAEKQISFPVPRCKV
jgi:hypothetical protein